MTSIYWTIQRGGLTLELVISTRLAAWRRALGAN